MKKLVDVVTGEILPVLVRSGFPFNYDADRASLESGLACQDESRTIQSAQEECDINTIVKRFGLSGHLPTDVRAPQYADFTDAVDFHTALNAVARARESFETLPADVRIRFNNDPGAFVDFCGDEANRDEAKKLGLVFDKPLPPPEKVLKVEVVQPSAVAPALSPGGANAAPGGVKA